ncbi:hypothetical protein [Moorena sp. SIO4G3]|uniref:hypothetical protein n=1 Tax=Moorena sp. SIO4G3 TaxID=2607821 RepID=UPI00142B1603|nr:hypothetical protein [Moorena sp. SIO4G3]NEO77084.1 hypothetical protein [Moorena sp. SIO4G3]
MGRWGDREMGRWGDGEMGRWVKLDLSMFYENETALLPTRYCINRESNLITVPCSRFPDPLFPIPDSRFPIPDSRFPTFTDKF